MYLDERHFLYSVYKRFSAYSEEGVVGVKSFHSGKPGPIIGFSACTHGNEPVGLAVLDMVETMHGEGKLLQGGVLCFLTNIRAAEAWFESETEEEKRMSRYIHMNMNRITKPRNPEESYEYNRVMELKGLLSTCDVGIDFHSTSIPIEPMALLPTIEGLALAAAMGVEKVMTQAEQVMGKVLLTSYYGGLEQETSSVLVECGTHSDIATFDHARDMARKAMQYYHVIEKDKELHDRNCMVYEMKTRIFLPDDSYRLVKDFGNFEFIKKRQVLAEGDGDPILAPHDGHAFSAFAGGRPPSITEEAMFMSSVGKRIKG